ncbi:type VII secretion-associated serine protease mycosin [Planosporangium flavigriseum]|uniref:Type VII secretion-associated serine protease n=1 Tax=Planosporangium flavigriseum TaxID=373681 RepID=A0A8J3LNA9_9ACTN|nr:type VII secretion-associated serine protease mycosin [Planosporangium flavigriseum]GIG73835.1 type VII secretion-associated serine protease [Planosporangium flavigriseum]
MAGAAAAALATLGVVPYEPTPAAAACTVAPQQQRMPTIAGQPWAQQRWGLDRLTALGVTGKNVVVAVIDSGVDARHPQLRGRVAPGWDAFEPSGNGQEDCVGHGTAVASLIAAQPSPDTPFRGLAPGATILPIRASERVNGNDTGRGTPADLARAIRAAVDRGAKVINLSLVLTEDRPEVRAAVAEAIARDVVVVAAVGNGHDPNSPKDATTYPAAYDGVIGVGAIDESDVRFGQSQTGTSVDLVAPGNQIPAAVPGGGYQIYAGTSFGAPFVSATAALVIQKYGPKISARQVATRLLATADPAAGSPGSPEYGQGVINPYRAVTGVLAVGAPPKRPPLPQLESDPAAEAAAAAAAARRRTVALSLAGGVGVLALVVVGVAVVVPRGRRRDWRPGTGRASQP